MHGTEGRTHQILPWLVYDKQGVCQAWCKNLHDAALLVALHGDGSTIRWDWGRVVWAEGKEVRPARDDLMGVVTTVYWRVTQNRG